MIKNFFHFKEISAFGLAHLRDPGTIVTNLLLFGISLWCYRRIAAFRSSPDAQTRIEARGWSLFFLFSSFAYLVGVPVHGFSWYIPEETHFVIWLFMGWMQNLAVVFAQFATAKWYFPDPLKWIRPLIILQFAFFSALMLIIRKFGAVNMDVAIALVPIAFWNIYLHSQKKLACARVGWGILVAALAGAAVLFKVMISDWFSYNDIAHVILMASLLLIYSGLVQNFRARTGSPQ